MKNPQTSICAPEVPSAGARCAERCRPKRKARRQRASGTSRSKRLRKTSSGKRARSLHAVVVGGKIPRAGHPADVRPPESAQARRMDILLVIRMLVVMPVDRSPPERAALDGGIAQDGKDELRGARGVEGPVGKIAVIKPGDGKHAHEIENRRPQTAGQLQPTRNTPRQPRWRKMKGMQRRQVDAIRLCAHGIGAFREVIGVKPSQEEGSRFSGGGKLGNVRIGHGNYPPRGLDQMQIVCGGGAGWKWTPPASLLGCHSGEWRSQGRANGLSGPAR